MLGEYNASPTIAVKDINTAKNFYGNVLGLQLIDENPGGVTYKSGTSQLFIYESADNAGTNKATYAAWSVPDIQNAVEELKSKGVIFEHYPDMPGVIIDGDVHTMVGEKAAWFTDPDGNILALDQQK